MRLRDLLGGASARLGVDRPIETGRIWARWGAIVGDGIAEHAEPLSLRGGVLRIRATTPTWAAELAYLVEQIKDAVNAEIGRPLVTEVVVSTGKQDRDRGSSRPPSSAPGKAPEEVSNEPPPSDAAEALKRAHDAWEKRRSKPSPSDSENPKNPW
jgi:Dna[CI] antecedent, DciA